MVVHDPHDETSMPYKAPEEDGKTSDEKVEKEVLHKCGWDRFW